MRSYLYKDGTAEYVFLHLSERLDVELSTYVFSLGSLTTQFPTNFGFDVQEYGLPILGHRCIHQLTRFTALFNRSDMTNNTSVMYNINLNNVLGLNYTNMIYFQV